MLERGLDSYSRNQGTRPGWGPEAPHMQPRQVPGLLLQVWGTPACPPALAPRACVSLSLCHTAQSPPHQFLFLCLSTTQYYEMSYGLNIEMHKQVRSPHPLQPQTGGPGPLAVPQVQSGLRT